MPVYKRERSTAVTGNHNSWAVYMEVRNQGRQCETVNFSGEVSLQVLCKIVIAVTVINKDKLWTNLGQQLFLFGSFQTILD